MEKETGEVLEYKGNIDRNGYKKYENESKTKIVRRHIKEEWNEQFRENRLSDKGKELYKFRKEKIERSFADSKNNHGYRYAMYRGLKKNQNYTWLICAAQNMKTISLRIENSKYNTDNIDRNNSFMEKIFKFILNFQKLFYKENLGY